MNIKYISIKIEPNGNRPAAGMTKEGEENQGDTGIGLCRKIKNNKNKIATT